MLIHLRYSVLYATLALTASIFSSLYAPSVSVTFQEGYHGLPDDHKERTPEESLALFATRLSRYRSGLGSSIHSKLDESTRRELEIDRLVGTLAYPETTIFGIWGLFDGLTTHYEIEDCKERQSLVKILVEDTTLAKEIGQALTTVKNAQESIISFWDPHDQLKQLAETFYFKWYRELNNYSSALEAGLYLDASKLALAVCAPLIFQQIQDEFFRWRQAKGAALQEQKQVATDQSKTTKNKYTFSLMRVLFGNMIRKHNPNASIFLGDNGKETYDLANSHRVLEFSMGDWILYNKNQLAYSPFAAKLSAYTTTLLEDIMPGALMYYATQNVQTVFNKVDKLRDRMVTIAAAFESIKRIAYCSIKYSELSDKDSLKPLTCFIQNTEDTSTKLSQLIELLGQDTFKENQSWIYRKGNVLLAYKLYNDIKDQLIPLWKSLGELESYCVMAKTYTESQGKGAQWCFAEFLDNHLDNQAPYIYLENFWNPLIAANNVITNTIELGKPARAGNALVTGPNGCGKSTIMKAIAYVDLISSFGIVPARKATLTPFDMIKTSINVTEKPEEHKSTFMAQKERIDELLQLALSLPDDHRLLLLIDEPLSGTLEEVAAEIVYEFGKTLSLRTSCMTVMATPLEYPLQLAKDTSTFALLHPELIEPQEGTFVRTFKLLDGPPAWWFDDRDKRRRFVFWLSALETTSSTPRAYKTLPFVLNISV